MHVSPQTPAQIPRCMLAASCMSGEAPRIGSSILCSSSQGSQDQTATLTLKGSAFPFPGPPGDKSQGLSHTTTTPQPPPQPRWISYQHFAAPQWLSEEKHGLVLRQRSRGPCGPGSGLDLASGFGLWLPLQALLRSPQTSHKPWAFTLVQPLSHLLDTVYLSAGNH